MEACCARAAKGHADAPPSSVMNSRRFTPVPPVLPAERLARLGTAALRDFNPPDVGEWDGPAVLRPRQHGNLARGAKDEEHAMPQNPTSAIPALATHPLTTP